MKTRAEIERVFSSNHKRYLLNLEKIKESIVTTELTTDDVWEMKLLEDQYDESPIRTGASFWDELVGSLRKGNLYVLAGYPGAGKTTLAAQLAWGVAKQGKKVWFYCLELKPTEVLEVLVGHIRGNAQPTEEDYAVGCTLAQNSGFMFFDSRNYKRWEDHLENIVQGIKKSHYELIVIDNFHFLTRVSKNGFEVEGVVSQRLKVLSQECNVPILLIHHLRKPDGDGQEAEPSVHALRGSSALLNDASAVVLLHHPIMDSEGEAEGERHPVGKLRYAKARWGKGGTRYVQLVGVERRYEQAYSEQYIGPRRGGRRLKHA